MAVTHDIAIIGAGAAGLAAGIFAGETAGGRGLRIVAIEGARKPGAKILVSGGGRCNVTNDVMSEEFFFGGSRPLIRNVLRAWTRDDTLRWFESMGVALKLESTGKYFPQSDSARSVLIALLENLRNVGVELRLGVRVEAIERIDASRGDGSFCMQCSDGSNVTCHRVIVAAGGLSLPKSGSDGAVMQLMRKLGHSIVPTTPALAPLVMSDDATSAGAPNGRALKALSGLTTDVRVTAVDAHQHVIAARDQSLLFTHFGLSGPAAMDISRHLARPRVERNAAPVTLRIGHPEFVKLEHAAEFISAEIRRNPRRSAASVLAAKWPARLADVLAPPNSENLSQLTRANRDLLVAALHGFTAPVTGDRGYAFAETTAGGVDLKEVDVRTMESRVVPGLHVCGEILDVDGCIGGYNFQWAWATGMLAGRAAVKLLSPKA